MDASQGGDGRAGIDAALVRRLIAAQFPQWRDLPIRPVPVDGWDNRTYRLGDDMTVRLPTAAGYVPAVEKENTWLPRLAPHLPVPVPPVLALGRPGEGYPHPWSVRGWLDGETATAPDRIADLSAFAVDLGRFVLALQAVDPAGGPGAGAHSFHRGTPPAYYDAETRAALAAVGDLVDTERAAAVWDAALSADFAGPPVWFHGDLAGGNLLVSGGRLCAVLDFGTSGTGDPACDLVIAWTLFSADSRAAFRRTVGQNPATWARARGWALWKALISVVRFRTANPPLAAEHARVIGEVLDDAAQR
ncbi:aminoglycoside phosphotransferase family protein [Actinacidiphila paucisporea]|uniref:Predicted kinase, aminoglycoside phosphotransferase (APT) family n=1 Tax=Actinacidiphila paucisporea TaxID=310782 RepID=A0A1M7PCB5_9ACTN|nr:Predicted kinase, aminoglycoside phosphotransferase (APT) family [Actinacidiphila paucisporea]